MTGQFLAQSRNQFLGNGAAVVSPLLSLISEDVGNLLVTQAFPWLHDRAAELLSFHRNWTLQTLHHDHSGPTGSAVGNFRASKRRITLTLRSESARLMAHGAIRHENFFAALGGSKLLLRLRSSATGAGTVRPGRDRARIQTVAAKASGEAAEIGAAKENREGIDSDQPEGKRLQTHARFLFFSLNRRVHFLHVLAVAIIHSLATPRYRIGGIHYFAAGLAATGEAAGEVAAAAGGGDAAAAGGLDGCVAGLAFCWPAAFAGGAEALTAGVGAPGAGGVACCAAGLELGSAAALAGAGVALAADGAPSGEVGVDGCAGGLAFCWGAAFPGGGEVLAAAGDAPGGAGFAGFTGLGCGSAASSSAGAALPMLA